MYTLCDYICTILPCQFIVWLWLLLFTFTDWCIVAYQGISMSIIIVQ